MSEPPKKKKQRDEKAEAPPPPNISIAEAIGAAPPAGALAEALGLAGSKKRAAPDDGEDGGAVDASPVREEYPIATDQTDDAADDDGEEADDGEELRRRLDELERLLYLGGVEHRDAEGALVDMFELASEAPTRSGWMA